MDKHSCPVCHLESKVRIPDYVHGYVIHIINNQDIYLENRSGYDKKYCPNENAFIDIRWKRFSKITKDQALNFARSYKLDTTLLEAL